MENKQCFWLTWPAVIVFAPFLLLSLGLCVGLAVTAPSALGPAAAGARSWLLMALGIWLAGGALLFGIYRGLAGRGEEGERRAEN